MIEGSKHTFVSDFVVLYHVFSALFSSASTSASRAGPGYKPIKHLLEGRSI